MQPPDDIEAEFAGIANELVSQQANDYLDHQIRAVHQWMHYREFIGQPADLRSLIDHIHQENTNRAPVIISLATALWRLKDIEERDAGQ